MLVSVKMTRTRIGADTENLQVTDLLVTSYVTGGNETLGRMIDCISGYATVQFVGIYPTLMIVMLRLSVWNIPESVHSSGTLALAAAGTSVISTVNFAPRPGRRAYIDDEQLDFMQSASNGSPVDPKSKISGRTSNEKSAHIVAI
ncbi:hypothetical protein EIP86_005316 [Pleurotus ostreatoroseus]|nr:hypothetical protein EIP86_005316 [Pleurotus ostreatoroseus]